MSAVISTCGLYRYRLERVVQPNGVVAALFGVNPSIADAFINDHTIRKDLGFGRVNGWRHIVKGNVFAYRSTDVTQLARVLDPVGPDNHLHIDQIVADADILVPCWGSRAKVPKVLHPVIDALAERLRSSGKPVFTLGLTATGDPRHTLTLGYTTRLEPWK